MPLIKKELLLADILDMSIKNPEATELGIIKTFENCVQKQEEIEKFNVYQIETTMSCYHGFALVAARNVEDANKWIEKYKEDDKKNYNNSFEFSNVCQYDLMENLYSDTEGIIFMN